MEKKIIKTKSLFKKLWCMVVQELKVMRGGILVNDLSVSTWNKTSAIIHANPTKTPSFSNLFSPQLSLL